MAESRIRFRCSACRKLIGIDSQHAGRRVKCPACGQALIVPQPSRKSPNEKSTVAKALPKKPSVPEPVSFWTRPMLIGLGSLVVLAGLMLIFGNLITRLFVVLVVLTALNGFWLGVSKVAAAIVGMLLAMLLAVPLGKLFEGLFAMVFGSSGLTNRMISIGICGLLLVMLISVLLSIPIKRAMKNRPTWRRYDKLLGTGLGLFEGALLGVLLIWAVLVLEPMAAANLARARDPDSELESSSTARVVVALARAMEESVLGRAAEVANPLKNMRVIRLFADAQTVLNDPLRREIFLNDPKMQRIEQRPSVRKALKLLSGRLPEVKMDDGLSSAEIRIILASPRFLEILDETDLLSELTPLADDIEQALNFAIEYHP